MKKPLHADKIIIFFLSKIYLILIDNIILDDEGWYFGLVKKDTRADFEQKMY